MRPALALAALSLALATRSGSAQGPEPRKPSGGVPAYYNAAALADIEKLKAEPKLGKLVTVGGSVLKGTVVAESIRVKSDLGELDVPLWQVQMVVNQRVRMDTLESALTVGLSDHIKPPAPEAEATDPDPSDRPPSRRHRRATDPAPPSSSPFKIGAFDSILACEIVTKEFQLSCEFGIVSVPWEKVAALDFVRRDEANPALVVPAPAEVPPGAPPAPFRTTPAPPAPPR